MQEKLYGYNCDYIERDGHYMMLTDAEQLTVNKLDILDRRMAEEHQIDGQLPIQIEEVNFEVKLLYRFTGLRKLSQELKVHSMTLTQCFQLLLAIVETLDSAKSYMLHEHRYVLQPDYIFVRSNFEDVQLMYLPIQKIQKADLKTELTELIVYCVSYVQDLQGDGFQSLLQLLRSDSFSLSAMRQELLKRSKQLYDVNRTTDEAFVDRQLTRIEPLYSEPLPAEPQPAESLPAQSLQAELAESYQAESDQMNRTIPPHQEHSDHDDDEFDELELYAGSDLAEAGGASVSAVKDPFKFTALLTVIGLVFAYAVIWRFYFAFASDGMLFISIGASMIAANAAFILLRRQRQMRDEALEQRVGLSLAALPKEESFTAEENLTSEQYYEQLGERTTLLTTGNTDHSYGDETEQLSIDQTEILTPDVIEAKCSVMLIHEDVSRSIELHSGRYRFGRDEAATDVRLDDKGVSRVHCEFLVEEDAVILKDLGSSNGTYVNEIKLVPYKSHHLTDGDQIRIGKAQYTLQF